MLFIKLSKELGELQSSANVRTLMASVKQDAQHETLSFEEAPILKAAKEMEDGGRAARIKIISFLNIVMYAITDYAKWDASDAGWIWIFENHTRLSKLLTVSMVLESANLRSFGAEPDWSDIPQCLLQIPKVIGVFRRTLKGSHEEGQSENFKKVKLEPSFGADYLKLYTNNEPK